MRIFGLIGYPLSHSFSKKYFSDKFETEEIPDCQYELYPLAQIAEIENLFSNPSLNGLNVTIPYKVAVLPFLNELEEAAEEIGAVNCIAVTYKEGKQWRKGYNTDAYGFEESLKPFLKPSHTKALIFGDGGAAKAIKYCLSKLGISYLIVGRKPAPGVLLYSEVTEALLETHTLLINTTPAGMYPNEETFPEIPYHSLGAQHLAYDLVYNPEETLFLQKVRMRGGAVKNGLEMLYLQAERSWEIWNP
ncbi:shikimate dehydrogenase [Pedobacter sp. MC2016-14]|uniref:shikimate dehydrogenase family protein n=1 Tax=Pedobacter sp. MC2016-14 TaxID=2897327 RepID=UPI001E57FC2A|nr:shikimate dehydrogenase [Pedobacter sp. MC2016-14]MCD0487136.1 shikimate dehydrogenase [Pedobacter sp. MC2016-14]